MKALVTGATGFVGGNLVRALVEEGVSVRALVRNTSSSQAFQGLPIEETLGDLEDIVSLKAALQGCTVLFHVAALNTFWARDPAQFYNVNIGGTRNVLAAAAEMGVERVVHTSTWAIIGRPSEGELATEDTLPNQEDLTGHYRQTKYLAEREVDAAVSRGQDVVILNPTVPVGPWDVKPSPSGRIVLDFLRGRMPAYIEAHLNLIAVEDVAQGHIRAWKHGRTGERYILGNQNMTLLQVLKGLEKITGKKRPRIKLPMGVALVAARLDGLVEGVLLRREPRIPLEGILHAKNRRAVDSSKAIAELGLPQSSVTEALHRSVAWFQEHGYV
ncbi:MAG: NAD-dependent epimerase/dehydratase family protein [SAR202 cluster bacterium]|nr:NAD-dependent epimerase/dehydratase family protein [SAR202 cluster bacterium]